MTAVRAALAGSIAAAGAARIPVAVYRDHLLRNSETFVLAQGEHLARYTAYYFGSRRVAGLPLPADRVRAVSGGDRRGAVREAAFKAFGLAPALKCWLEALRPALVHAHFADGGAVVLPLTLRLGLPLVVSLHGYDVTSREEAGGAGSLLRRRYLARLPALAQNGSLFLAVSEFIRAQALQRGFPAARTVVHYTGVDTGFFSPDPAVTRSDTVLFVGRLVEKKGCVHLLRAMRFVAERISGVRVVVCGDGPKRAQVEREARTCGCQVAILGYRSVEEVRDLMRAARVLCVPSTIAGNGDAEGFGMIFAEAQAVGLPVVSFATGGVPEAVDDGCTGLLVADRDEAALAEALLRLLQDRALWTRMSRNGCERVRSCFDLDTQCRRLEDLYDHAGPSAGLGS